MQRRKCDKNVYLKRLHETFIQTGKTTAIRRVAVRETIASLGIKLVHLRGALELLGPSQHYPIEGFKGALNWASIMLRVASLLDSRCIFFQSGSSAIHLDWKFFHQPSEKLMPLGKMRDYSWASLKLIGAICRDVLGVLGRSIINPLLCWEVVISLNSFTPDRLRICSSTCTDMCILVFNITFTWMILI